ncbi:EAL domain-containing protein [Actinoplanes sp. NPDC049596]|uniref:putative bifunctional diguanylate cyclase/phosphodiesterase n=1 Tax=unclassified Actinoplanes TaxID=2626549 RepID=UPI0034459661
MLNIRSWLPAGGGLRDEDWARRHRLLTLILAGFVGGLTVFGAWRDELGNPLALVLLMLTLAAVVAGRLCRGRRLPSSFVSFGFTAGCADFVVMCHGQTEAHFTFFVTVAALALYRDWAPFGMVLVTTVFHHAAFGIFDAEATYGHHSAQQHPLFWAVIHGVAVLFAAAFQVVAWRLTEAEEARAQASLDKSQAQLGVAFDETPVPMAMISPDGVLLRTNSAYRSWLRLPDELPAGFRVSDLPIVSLDPKGSALGELLAAPDSAVLTRQYQRRDDGSIMWIEVHSTGLRDAAGNLEMVFVHCLDVTDSRLHEEELRHQVRHDALTGLLSRPGFEGDLTDLLAERSGPVSVLYLDIDRFKSINDGLGHAAGDELLRALATRLEATVPTGALVARLGGDEFVVALAGPVDAGCKVGREILAAFAEPLTLSSGHIQISISVGMALGRAPEQAEDTMLAADTAMYAAKRAGGNRLQVFSDEMRVAVKERIAAEARLRAALAGDREASLPVWFQPIVSTATGRIVGAEALVRMFTPEGTLLGPGHFIPAAEETGLIVPLGEHVLRLAVRHLMTWRNQLPYISINVSPRQLNEPDFVATVAAVLAEYPGLDPSRVVLEITETALLGSSVDVRERLEALKALGVRVALDDFGTGYSSLTWLQSVPADVVKLDRSFVAGLAADPRKSSIISAVLWLARSLNMTVVAEGVEDPEDWKALQAAECESCQGFLFGRPLPASEFELMLPFPEPARTRQLAS